MFSQSPEPLSFLIVKEGRDATMKSFRVALWFWAIPLLLAVSLLASTQPGVLASSFEATLEASPITAVPNQVITVGGQGFTAGRHY
jgi:hypothetical protein